jgi:hypothetical protein
MWTMAFFGLFAVFAICPFCGRPGCPGGALVVGPLGGLVMTLLRGGRSLFRRRRDDAREQPISDACLHPGSVPSKANLPDCKVNREHNAAK